MARETESADRKLKRWSRRISDAKDYHEKRFLWWAERVEDYWRRRHWGGTATANLEQLAINLVYANAQTIVPRLFFQNPQVIVTPILDRHEETGPDGEPVTIDVVANAPVVKAVLEQKARQIGLERQQRTKIRNAYLHMGWSKIGWGTQYGQGYSRRKPAKESRGGDAGPPLQRTPVTGPSQDVKRDAPWVLSVHPRDVWLPSWTRSYDDMDFLVHRLFRREEDVRADARYSNTDDLIGTRLPEFYRDRFRGLRERTGLAEERFVELHEVHYRDSDADGMPVYRLLVLAEGHDGILLDEENGIENVLGHYQFRPLVFAEDPDGCYPLGDLYQGLPLQDEINKLRSYGLELVKRQPAAAIVDRTRFDEKELEKLQSPEPARIVSTQGDPNTAVAIVQPPTLTQDFYAYQQRMTDDWREITGVGPNQQGSSGVNTATEASIIQSNLDVRTQDKVQRVKEDYLATLKDVAVLLREFSSVREIVRIVGPEGARWTQWDADTLKGEYDFDMDVSSMLAPNNPVKKKLALDFFNVAVTVPQTIDLTEAARGLVRAYSDVFPNPEKLLREGEVPDQDSETVAMLAGQPAKVEAWHPHAEHLQKLQTYAQSPSFEIQPPEVQKLLTDHGNAHQAVLQSQQGGKRGLTAPGQGAGAVPAMMGNAAPTLSSIAAGASGGRPV